MFSLLLSIENDDLIDIKWELIYYYPTIKTQKNFSGPYGCIGVVNNLGSDIRTYLKN